MASKAHLTFNSTAYNRRDSFGLGWADQWDYKFNDEKLLKSNSYSSCNKMANPSSSSSTTTTTTTTGATTGLFTSKLGIGNIGTKSSSSSSSSSSLLRPAKFGKENRSSNSSSSSSLVHKSPLGSSKKLADINKKVTSAANSSAHKVKSSTHMGIKWLKKQCSLKTLKSSDHSA